MILIGYNLSHGHTYYCACLTSVGMSMNALTVILSTCGPRHKLFLKPRTAPVNAKQQLKFIEN